MKLFTLVLFIVSGSALSNNNTEFETGIFQLLEKPFIVHFNACRVVKKLTLDKSEIHGNIAFVDEDYAGDCFRQMVEEGREDKYFERNIFTKLYKITATEESRCGSLKYYLKNIGFTAHQNALVIVDNRNYKCSGEVPKLKLSNIDNDSRYWYYDSRYLGN